MTTRREVLQGTVCVATSTIVPSCIDGATYETPPGEIPIEVLKDGEWIEFPFDDLMPDDIMRAKQWSNYRYLVTSEPELLPQTNLHSVAVSRI